MVARADVLAFTDPDVETLNDTVSPLALAAERVLGVLPGLAPLFPDGGVVRGHCVACAGPAAMSTALALAAQPTRAGHWLAVVGITDLGARAATELGVALERLVLVDGEGGHDPAVLAALVDGFDVVMLGGADRVRPAIARRLQARAHARGAVLVLVGSPGGFSVDVELRGDEADWEGLQAGAGRLLRRRVVVEAAGRRISRPRRCTAWLPGPSGALELPPAESTTTAVERHVWEAANRLERPA